MTRGYGTYYFRTGVTFRFLKIDDLQLTRNCECLQSELINSHCEPQFKEHHLRLMHGVNEFGRIMINKLKLNNV